MVNVLTYVGSAGQIKAPKGVLRMVALEGSPTSRLKLSWLNTLPCSR